MKAITICQPFAHLIITPQSELPNFAVRKRVENRTWSTKYRGELLIHAGKSMKFLHPGDKDSYPEMTFGAILGIAKLNDCVRLEVHHDQKVISKTSGLLYPWLLNHHHAEGPYCWILERVRRFEQPIPCNGAQGLWVPKGDVLERVTEQLEAKSTGQV